MKNPDYSDTLYVTELVVADTVNTMPEKTLHAFADHGEVARRQGHRHGPPRRRRCSTTLDARRHRPRPTCSWCWRARASRSSRSPGPSCGETVTGPAGRGAQLGLTRAMSDDRGTPGERRRTGAVRAADGSRGPGRRDRRRQHAVADGDPPLWGPERRVRGGVRLAWTTLHETSRPLRRRDRGAARGARVAEGVDRVVLAGWAARRWPPEVITGTAGVPLVVLDTTDPAQVADALAGDLPRTVLVVSSKPGVDGGDRQPPRGSSSRPHSRAEGIDAAARDRASVHRPRLAAGRARPGRATDGVPGRPRRRRPVLGADRVRPGARPGSPAPTSARLLDDGGAPPGRADRRRRRTTRRCCWPARSARRTRRRRRSRARRHRLGHPRLRASWAGAAASPSGHRQGRPPACCRSWWRARTPRIRWRRRRPPSRIGDRAGRGVRRASEPARSERCLLAVRRRGRRPACSASTPTNRTPRRAKRRRPAGHGRRRPRSSTAASRCTRGGLAARGHDHRRRGAARARRPGPEPATSPSRPTWTGSRTPRSRVLRAELARRTGLPTTFGWAPRFLHSAPASTTRAATRTACSCQLTGDRGRPGLRPRPPTHSDACSARRRSATAALAARGRPVLRLHFTDRVAGLVTLARAVQEL